MKTCSGCRSSATEDSCVVNVFSYTIHAQTDSWPSRSPLALSIFFPLLLWRFPNSQLFCVHYTRRSRRSHYISCRPPESFIRKRSLFMPRNLCLLVGRQVFCAGFFPVVRRKRSFAGGEGGAAEVQANRFSSLPLLPPSLMLDAPCSLLALASQDTLKLTGRVANICAIRINNQ
jgi:hypothetical protein